MAILGTDFGHTALPMVRRAGSQADISETAISLIARGVRCHADADMGEPTAAVSWTLQGQIENSYQELGGHTLPAKRGMSEPRPVSWTGSDVI